jgi:hypothetical protein
MGLLSDHESPLISSYKAQNCIEQVAANGIACEMSAYIELFGLPASGKTTLLESLVEPAANENLKLLVPLPRSPLTPKDKWNKFVRDVSSVTRLQFGRFNVSREIWRACQLFRQPTITQQTRRYLDCVRLESLVRQYSRIASQHDVIAFDQGLFQAIWSLALQADVQDQKMLSEITKPILNVMTTPHLVIFVDTPREVAYRRLVREPPGHGRLVSLMKEDPSWMDHACMHLETIWDLTGRQPGVRTFHWIPDKVDARDLIDLIKRCSSTNRKLN